MRFALCMQLKQYAGRIVTRANNWPRVFDLFETGDPKFFLFQPIVGFDTTGLGVMQLTYNFLSRRPD